MTLRSAVYTGTAGSAWPALDSGDTWATSFWASPAVDATQIAAGPTAAVDGSSRGYITATHNLSPLAWTLGTPTYTTNASVSSRYTFTVGSAPILTTANALNLLFVTTSWTASHYHAIASASCTGSWSGLTYDKITDYVYNIGAVYYCLSIFRTTASSGTTTGDVAVDIYSTATSALIATQATGGTFQAFAVNGVDTTSNGANAIRTANTTTGTNTTGQPTITLPNNLSKYSSLPMLFCSHGTNNSSSSSSDAGMIATGSYGTPSNGVATHARIVPSTVATVKTQRTMTANFATATTGWGAIGIEILDSSSSDTYTDRTRDYTYLRIASNTSQPAYQTSEVRAVWTSADGIYGPYHGLVGRYVTSGGTKYWLGSSLRMDSVKGYGNAYVYAAVDNGTTTSVTNVAFTTGSTNALNTVTASAMRVRVLASGDLWVSAKYWVNGASEPAWPSLSSDPSTYSASPAYAVVNGTYSTSDALRNATSGATGLYYLYPATATPYTSNTSYVGPTDGVNTTTWTSWSNEAWVESGSSTLTGTGSGTGTGLRIAIGASSLTGVGSLAADAIRTTLGTATLTGTGALTSDAIRMAIGVATLSGVGILTGTGVGLAYGSASLSGTGSLVALGTRFVTALAALSGSGSLIAEGGRFVPGGSVSSAIVALAHLTTTVEDGPGRIAAALDGTGAVSSTHVLRP